MTTHEPIARLCRLWNLVSSMVLDTFRAFKCNSVDEILSPCFLQSLTHGISSFSIAGQSADFPLLAILDFGIFWIRSFCFLQDLTFDSSIVNSRLAARLLWASAYVMTLNFSLAVNDCLTLPIFDMKIRRSNWNGRSILYV